MRQGHDRDALRLIMLSLEEISDRLEIQQLLAAYCTAIDAGRFDELDQLFTDDAEIDLSVTGGAYGPFGEVKAWLIETLSSMGAYMHLVSNIDLRLTGDTATARTACVNPLVLDSKSNAVYLICFWYEDEFTRTSGGWRFRKRTQVKCLDKLI
jgi:hypothetical protein